MFNINSDNMSSLINNKPLKFDIKSIYKSSLVNEQLKFDTITDVTHIYLYNIFYYHLFAD